MPRKRKLPPGIKVRRGAYYADVYLNGKRWRGRLSTDLDAATRILNKKRARADQAGHGILDNDYPIEDLRRLYLDHIRQAKRPATLKRYTRSLDTILPQMAATRVSHLRVEQLFAFRKNRLAEGVSPRTVNHDTTILHAMLRWGATKAKVIGSNPLAGIDPLPDDNPKEGRPLTRDEVTRLLNKSPAPWRDIWYALLVTGMRRGELAALTFQDIDHDARELVIPDAAAKNHTGRRIPIDADLWTILQKQEAGREARDHGRGKTHNITRRVVARFTRDRVFVTTQNTPLDHASGLYDAFIRCCGLAGIETKPPGDQPGEHVDIHSLRRTFATDLISNGADPKSVQELLGHKTLEMTMKIYAKIHGGTKRQAVGKLSYGSGTFTPAGVLEFPANGKALPVQNSHQSVTEPMVAKTESA